MRVVYYRFNRYTFNVKNRGLLTMGWVILIFIIIVLFLVITGNSKQQKIDIINSALSKTLIRGEGANAEYYIINIPIRVHSPFHRNNNSSNELRIKFSSIYFEISKGNFNMGDSEIAYSLQELYDIFKQGLKYGKSQISINWRSRDLFIYNKDHPRVLEAKYLKLLYEEFQSISNIISDLEKEISQVEMLIKTIGQSEIYDYQLDTYHSGIQTLKKSKSRAIEVKKEYSKFLKERTLSFYLEDIEPAIFKLKNKELNWGVKYQCFHEDFNDLKSMVKEYNALKNAS